MFYRPHKRVQFFSGDVLVTKQSMKAECDIHTILKQYQKTGVLNHVTNARPTYEDLPDQQDYQTALHTIMHAENAFADLPASVRDRFGNDPVRLLGALSDPTQADYLREVGILKRPTAAPSVPEPVPVPPPVPPTEVA